MGKKILIVEDEKELLELLAARLSEKGYETVTAVNGVDALSKVQNDRPDLVLLDVYMPEMDGVDLYQEFKKDPNTKKLPIIVLSAGRHLEDDFRKIGVEDFITKPFEDEDLFGKVHSLLQRTGKKRILLICDVDAVASDIGSQLKSKTEGIKTIVKTGDVIKNVREFEPDIILCNVLLENTSAVTSVKNIRKMQGFKDKPLIIFSYIDKNDAAANQKKLENEKAKVDCMHSGATAFVGDYTDESFLQKVSEHL